MREEAITNSIIETKNKCDLLTHQNGSFGDLERAIYLCQQEHGYTYQVLDQSAPLLLAYYLTLSKLFPEPKGYAQLIFDGVGRLDINEVEAGLLTANPQLFEIISECVAYLDNRLNSVTTPQSIKQNILHLNECFRFYITMKSNL